MNNKNAKRNSASRSYKKGEAQKFYFSCRYSNLKPASSEFHGMILQPAREAEFHRAIAKSKTSARGMSHKFWFSHKIGIYN